MKSGEFINWLILLQDSFQKSFRKKVKRNLVSDAIITCMVAYDETRNDRVRTIGIYLMHSFLLKKELNLSNFFGIICSGC